MTKRATRATAKRRGKIRRTGKLDFTDWGLDDWSDMLKKSMAFRVDRKYKTVEVGIDERVLEKAVSKIAKEAVETWFETTVNGPDFFITATGITVSSDGVLFYVPWSSITVEGAPAVRAVCKQVGVDETEVQPRDPNRVRINASYGADTVDVDVFKESSVRQALAETAHLLGFSVLRLNDPSSMMIIVNGDAVAPEYVVQEGDQVELLLRVGARAENVAPEAPVVSKG